MRAPQVSVDVALTDMVLEAREKELPPSQEKELPLSGVDAILESVDLKEDQMAQPSEQQRSSEKVSKFLTGLIIGTIIVGSGYLIYSYIIKPKWSSIVSQIPIAVDLPTTP